MTDGLNDGGSNPVYAFDLLARSASRRPDHPAVICAGVAWSYGQLRQRAEAAASWIQSNRIATGDAVAVLSANCPDYAALVFGAAKAGAVLAHLSLRARGEELQRMLETSGARLLVLGPGAPDTTVLGSLPDGLRCVPLSTLMDEAANMPRGDSTPQLQADSPYAITFTGGTTGLPKGVLVSHRARAGQADNIARGFGLSADDTVAVATPMFHVAGLFVWFQPAIAMGATCVLLPAWDVEAFLAAVASHGISAAMLVPTQLIDLLRHGERLDARLASMRRIVYAGAPMPAAVLDELTTRLPWIEFVENYGQSELGAVTVRRGADLPAKRGSVGRALPGLEVAVVDERGRPLAAGAAGQLVSRGPHLLSAYHGRPEETAALFPFGEGWLATGDIAVMDEDGFVTLVDRAKDMIISGAENIYPVEIENVLHQHPAVAECAVIGRDDARLGEVPVAYVVLRSGVDARDEDLVGHCLQSLPRHKRPRDVRFVDALPKTAVGKVQKNVLRDQDKR